MRPEVVAVVGATATGKSDLAIALAQAVGGEIINADSMQTYRGMDIGTAKVPVAERGGIPHHLLDIWDVTQPASVVAYRDLARSRIAEVTARGRLPIVVGGSGLYVRAVLDELDFPGQDPCLRAELNDQLDALGPHALHERLAAQDPVAATRIEPGNGRRIVRALEVIALTGQPFAAKLPAMAPRYRALTIGLTVARPELNRRLDARVQRMWQSGFVAEVRTLPGLAGSPTASRALGYRQILAMLAGACSDAEAQVDTATATRRFAKRQMSWFARDPSVVWLAADDGLPIAEAQAVVKRFDHKAPDA